MNPTIPDDEKFTLNNSEVGGMVQTTKYFVENLVARPMTFDQYQTMTVSTGGGKHDKHPTTTVPEPSTYLLVGLGVFVIVLVKKIF